MKYNKLFEYENKGFHKPLVAVDEEYKIKTAMMPKDLMPLLARELSSTIGDTTYLRANPYKFNTKIDRHVYIQYAEPRNEQYEVFTKRIVQISHKGNFKIPEGTFLFDLLDYFVQIGMLDKEYNFIGVLPKREYRIIDVHTEKELKEQGFIFI